MLKDNKNALINDQFRQHLPFLQRKKIGAESYVSQRLNRIRKQKSKQTKQKTISEQESDSKWKDPSQIRELKKNFIVSTNKVISSQQILSSFEPFRKQLQLIRKKPSATIDYDDLLSNLHPFSSAIRELQQQKDKQRKYLLNKQPHQNTHASIKLYRSIPRRKASKNSGNAKPVSQTRIQYQQVYFLNVGKISLLDAQQKNKKYGGGDVCHSSLVEKRVTSFSLEQQKQQQRQRQRQKNQDSSTNGNGNSMLSRIRNQTLNSKSNSKLMQQIDQSRDIKLPRISYKQLEQEQQENNANNDENQNNLYKTNNNLNLNLNNNNDLDIQTIQKIQQAQSLSLNVSQNHKKQQSLKKQSMPIRKRKKLVNIPFQTYYYRTLIWKVNYTNLMAVQIPQQYEHRLRMYIGKGNNSGLVRGLIKRRIWFAVTDKIEEANFVWTQLKSLPYFKLQEPSQTPQKLEKLEKPQKIQKIQKIQKLQKTQRERIQKHQKHQKHQSHEKHQNNQRHTIHSLHHNHQKHQKHQKSQKHQKHQNHHNPHHPQKHQKQQSSIQHQYTSTFITKSDQKQMRKYIQNYLQSQQRSDQRLLNRNKCYSNKFLKIIKINDIKSTRMQNHLINNYVIGNKKALFHTMSSYYAQRGEQVFDYLPLTFHIKKGLQDPIYFKFLKYFYSRAKQIKSTNSKHKNIWIVKPGQNSNRGNGINVCLNLQQIKSLLKRKQMYPDGTYRTYIVQSYIQKPLLYNKRKFDLRHYMMISCVNGIIKGYWYRQGYVRTTSTQYSLGSNCNKIHLTNDAVQKNLPDYGKYQKGNKLSYDQLQNYIVKVSNKSKNPISFKQNILPKMKKIATDAIRACSGTIDPQKKQSNFQIFGLDFMIDSQFKLYLIQINTNPCLELSCPLLGAIIPKMVQNTLELTLDTQFPPPVRYYPKGMHYFKNLQEENKYQLVYDSRIEKIYQCSMDVLDQKLLEEEDDTFQDDGEEFDPDD